MPQNWNFGWKRRKMNSLEILQILSHLPCHTVGVFPSDMIPQTWQKPTAFVFNTDSSKKPGTYWVAVYVDQKSNGYFFDSYGLPADVPSYVQRMRKNCKTLRWNDLQYQIESSTVCGQFCITFLHFMACGIGKEEFFNLFGQDLRKNDEIAKKFLENLRYRKKIKCDSIIGDGQKHIALLPQSCRPKRILHICETLWNDVEY